MAKGQVTIPKDVRKTLGISNGDRISFIVEGNTVRIVNSAVYAMQVLQQEMKGEARKAGLVNDFNFRYIDISSSLLALNSIGIINLFGIYSSPLLFNQWRTLFINAYMIVYEG